MIATMRQQEVGDLARAFTEIAHQAGRVILECRDHGIAIMQKDDSSPVTEADRRAEDVILSGLTRTSPGVPVISEEAAAEGEIPEISHRFLLVDPLDGTREFVAGRDEFTVNIALVENGRPVAGTVYAPALGTLAFGDANGARQATVNARQSMRDVIWHPITTREVPQSGLAALASRSHRDPETDAFLRTHDITDTRSAGSSLKFVMIARGEADVYPRFGRTMEWDTAAGHAVLAAAGGVVLTADGSELRYGKRQAGYANPVFIAWGRAPRERFV